MGCPRGFSWSLVAALGLAPGCGEDPILARADDERADEATEKAGGAGPAGPGRAAQPAPGRAGEPPPGQAGDPTTRRAEDPPPGIPEEPTPGDPGSPPPPGGAQPEPPPNVPRTTVSGVIVYDGYRAGPIRIDVFDGDQRDFSRHPGVVAWADLAAPGPFAVLVPTETKKVWISAFNDANLNGRPDDDDPRGYHEKSPVAVDQGDIEGIVVTLVHNPQPAE